MSHLGAAARRALGQRPEVAEVEQPVDHVQVGRGQPQLAERGRPEPLRHRRRDLEPNRLGRALPAAEERLERRQQVVGLVDLDLDVGIPRDAERVVFDDLHPREEPVRGVAAITCSSGTNRRPPDSFQNRGRSGRHLDASESPHAGLRVAHDDGEVEREVGDVRERVRRVDGERGQNGEHVLLEDLPQLLPLRLLQIVPVGDPDPIGLRAAGGPASRRPAPGARRAPVRELGSRRVARAGSSRPATCPGRRPTSCSRRPETRIWKNSSRFRPKIARNRARSSGGRDSSSAQARMRAL